MLDNIILVKKKIKNINIRIRPNGDVYVSAPLHVSNSFIERVLQKRASWIQQKQQKIKQYKRNFQDSSIVFYLGYKYPLKIIKSDDNCLVKEEKSFLLRIDDILQENKKDKIIEEFYRQKAKELFSQIIEKYTPIVQKKVHRLSIKKMRTRWGSCNNAKGYINLNLHLIKTPIKCIEYVVFHELTHLIHPNHSKNFYVYLQRYMADYKKREKLLEDFRLFYM